MTTAVLLLDWHLYSDVQSLTVYRNGNVVCCVTGENAEWLAHMIRNGAGADQVDEKVQEMYKTKAE